MKQTVHLSEKELKGIIKCVLMENINTKPQINEGQYDDNPIKKWVYWCFNYHSPDEWIGLFRGAPTEHFMEKWEQCHGDMNRFFVELDGENQEILINYVINNY